MTTGLLDALLLVLRTVPVYPAGHQRVRSSLVRLQTLLQTAAANGEHLFVEVIPKGLRFQDEPLDMKAPGRQDLRDALVATAVADLAVWVEASDDSLMQFSQRLNQNIRKATASHVTFDDLWGEPIEGVWVGEQLYDDSGLSEGDGLTVGDAGLPSAKGTDAAGVTPQTHLGSLRRLRRLTLGCPRTRLLLRQVSEIVRARSGPAGGEQTDILDQILALLPAEARRFPLQGLKAVERTLEAFLAEMKSLPPDAAARDSDAVLAHTVAHLFPSAASATATPIDLENPDPGLPPTPLMLRREREKLLTENIDLLVKEVSVDAGAAAPRFAETAGRGEYGCALLDAFATAPPERREPVRRRLVGHLKGRKDGADVGEIIERLKVLATTKAPAKDADPARGLASLLWEADLDDVAAESVTLAPEMVARTFPYLFRAYLASPGDQAGPVCRLAGRDAIVQQGDDLLAPRGALNGPGAEAVLAERSLDVLPLWEVLLRNGSKDVRGRVAQAMNAISIPVDAAVVLKVAAPEGLPIDMLCGICEDGFKGKDTHRFDRAAVAALSAVIDAPPPGSDAGTVPFAISALRYFATDLVSPILNRLLERRGLMHVYPRAIRGFAKAVLTHREEVDRAPPGTRPEMRA